MRNIAKHTPVWYISTCPETHRSFLCEYGVDNNIAELFGTLSQNNLIAAAPELLEALCGVHEWIEQNKHIIDCGDSERRIWLYNANEKARAAIAKAEGRE